MSYLASVMKELQSLMRKAGKIFDGQVQVFLDDGEMDVREHRDDFTLEEYCLLFYFTVTPSDGLYKNAKFLFRVIVEDGSYPLAAPVVQCVTDVYHPNIDTFENTCNGYDVSNICVSLLGEDWQPEVGLEGSVMAVLFLFYNPQIDDALSPICCNFAKYSDYEETVYDSLRGLEIDGNKFDCLIEDDKSTSNIKAEEDMEEKTQSQINETADTPKAVENFDHVVIKEEEASTTETDCEDKDTINYLNVENTTTLDKHQFEDQTTDKSKSDALSECNLEESEGLLPPVKVGYIRVDVHPSTDISTGSQEDLTLHQPLVDARPDQESMETATSEEIFDNNNNDDCAGLATAINLQLKCDEAFDHSLPDVSKCNGIETCENPDAGFKVRLRNSWSLFHVYLTKLKGKFCRTFHSSACKTP